MKRLQSKWLDMDQMIKSANKHPYQVIKLEKAVLQINHNPAIKNTHAIIPAIWSSIELTNQYPVIKKASLSYASFGIRKGMQNSLMTTIRRNAISELYYKFLFQIYPQQLNTIDTTIEDNIFKKLPNTGNFHFGIKGNVSGNLIFVLGKDLDILKRFYLSYWNLPVKANLA